MRFILNWLKPVSAVLLAGVLASNVSAGVIVTFAPDGNDVVATVSGYWVGLTGFASQEIPTDNVLGGGGEVNSFSTFTGQKFGRTFILSKVSGPSTWGTSASTRYTNADSNTISTHFAFITPNNDIPVATTLTVSPAVPNATPITGSMTFSNRTMSSMGLDNYGTFVYKIDGTNETLTFVLSSGGGGGTGGEVPEPSTMAIFGLGAIGIAYRARRKAKA